MRTRQVTNAAILRVSTLTVIEHHGYQTVTNAAILRVSTLTVIEHHAYQTGNYCSYIESVYSNSY